MSATQLFDHSFVCEEREEYRVQSNPFPMSGKYHFKRLCYLVYPSYSFLFCNQSYVKHKLSAQLLEEVIVMLSTIPQGTSSSWRSNPQERLTFCLLLLWALFNYCACMKSLRRKLAFQLFQPLDRRSWSFCIWRISSLALTDLRRKIPRVTFANMLLPDWSARFSKNLISDMFKNKISK